jgi:putative ABC transport system permease protein
MTILQDIRYACRLLVKDLWFTTIAAVALGLGIGMNTTVFTFVNAVLIRGLPFDHSEEILFVSGTNPTTGNDSSTSWPDLQDWRSQTHAFAGLAGFRFSTMNVSDAGHPAERAQGNFVSANTFGLLRQAPLLGRDFAPDEDRKGAEPVVILGYNLWKTRYGSDPAIVGRPIKVNDVICTVIGVMPEGMKFPTNADIWRPLVPDAELEKRDSRPLGVFGRLAPESSRSKAQAEMNAIAARLQKQYPESNKELGATRVMTFNERFNGGPIRVVFLALMGAVGFVLLIACANVANLLLARSARRSREVALRVAIGATRGRIVRQLLVESTLLACIGGLLGLGLSYIGIGLFDRAVADVGKPYWIRFTMDYWVFGFMAVVCLLTGTLFGLAPALQVSRTNVNEILKEGGRGNAGGVRSRKLSSVMVVAEIALTLVLLVGAGLMIRSFLKLYSLDIGVDTTHVLTMRTVLSETKYPKPEARQQFFDALVTRLRSVPGVAGASVASNLPMQGGDRRLIDVEGQPPADEKAKSTSSLIAVGPEYFGVLGIPVRRGRALQEQDGTPGREVVVVNERFAARQFPGEDPIGRRIRQKPDPRDTDPRPWMTIVGIVGNVRQNSPQDVEPDGVIYQSARQQAPRGTNIIVRAAGSPAPLIGSIREAIRNVDPDQPLFDVRTFEEVLAQNRWPYKVFGSMFTIFALIAVVLSAVGIYGVTAYSVTQRTSEIGVRMALGAQPKQVSWMILKTGLLQLAIGLTLGLLGGWGASFALKSLVVQIKTTDPVTFLAISTVLSGVTLVSCLIPARRATRLDPLAALRE